MNKKGKERKRWWREIKRKKAKTRQKRKKKEKKENEEDACIVTSSIENKRNKTRSALVKLSMKSISFYQSNGQAYRYLTIASFAIGS